MSRTVIWWLGELWALGALALASGAARSEPALDEPAASAASALPTTFATASELDAAAEMPVALRDDSADLPEPKPLDEAFTSVPVSVPTFKVDLAEFPERIWDDTKSLVSLKLLAGVGAGAALAGVSANNWDQNVRADTRAHPRRWGGLDNALDVVGHPATPLSVGGALYAYSLLLDDVAIHDFSRALIHSLILTDGTVIVLKYSFDTTRPNGRELGFPSGHTASAFAAAAVIEKYHGLLPGLGAYAVAGLVGYSRIDNRNHDLSDVLFGAALGYAIGTVVADNHLADRLGVRLDVYQEPLSGTTGISIERKY